MNVLTLLWNHAASVGRNNVFGIATLYGLDGAGIEFRCRRDFPHPSRPALGSTQPPMQWEPGLSRGVKRPVHDVDPPTATIAEVKERVEVYIYSPFGSSWPVVR